MTKKRQVFLSELSQMVLKSQKSDSRSAYILFLRLQHRSRSAYILFRRSPYSSRMAKVEEDICKYSLFRTAGAAGRITEAPLKPVKIWFSPFEGTLVFATAVAVAVAVSTGVYGRKRNAKQLSFLQKLKTGSCGRESHSPRIGLLVFIRLF